MGNQELGWVMGLIDGEGSILLAPSMGRRYPRIMLPSTDIEILETLKQLCGGYIVYKADKRKHVHRAWTWILSSSKFFSLLKKGVHLLRSPQKAARANFLLENWKPRMSREERQLLTERFFAIQDLRERRFDEP